MAPAIVPIRTRGRTTGHNRGAGVNPRVRTKVRARPHATDDGRIADWWVFTPRHPSLHGRIGLANEGVKP